MSNYNLAKRIDVREVCANIDALYGPYISIEAACLNIPINRRSLGRTVAIEESGGVTEYWWKSGITDDDLVQKVEQMTLSLHLVGDSTIAKEEGESIFGRFMVDGGAGVKKAILYQVVNGNEVYIREYTDVGKSSTYTFNIPSPTVSGTYIYRLKVVDSLDNYAIASDNSNYLEYTLSYGGISTVYNFTQLNAITVKNYESIAEQPFQINIAVRDETFRISSVCLTDSTDNNSGNLSVSLTPYINAITQSDTFLGNNTYYMPDASTLNNFNGKECSIVIHYVEGSTSKEKTQILFKLLDISTLELVPEHEGDNFYATVPGYYTFQLKSGVENLSIVLTPGQNSDFNFERSTILAYRRFSLKIVPNDIEKNNAQIVINYRYNYNNVEYSGSFTRTIGNILSLPPQAYYEPTTGSTTSLVKLVDSNESDYTDVEDGQYYKIISESITTEQLSSSFILDTYCKINQQNNRNIKYITIAYGGIEVASVTEDEISCANKWNSLYTDTPINEWAQIGIGINLQESFRRNNEDITGYYHAIYINGMIVKTVAIDSSINRALEFNNNSQLVITIGNGILVQKCFLYYRNDGENVISPNNIQNTPIIYNNFKSHKRDFEEPQDLPLLKFLRISNPEEAATYFNYINAYKEEHDEDLIVHLTKFGTIGDSKAASMQVYDPYYDSNTIESDATLFRQHVDIKKPAQNEYAVLCRVQWMGTEMNNIIVEVHTQGTSTLVYSIPNFKFTFWELIGNSVQRYYPEFIEKEGTNEYYRESIYTAKADFMDSSHLNNTPTCNYYNILIKSLINANVIEGSPSARNGMLDAIMGFPIVMEISDTANSFDDIFTNIGSFMLNIDKTGNSLGFEVEENNETLSCISFEGTSNDNDSGAAGRFDIPIGLDLKDYTNNVGEINESEIRDDWTVAKAAISAKKTLDDYWEVNGTNVLVRNLPYVKWCLFLSDGLEYRYPDADIYKLKNNLLNKVMNVDHFIALYKMWWWVYNSDTLSASAYREQFEQHFDLYYCMIYFINLMIYAQTDNLGKNAMFDCWDGEHWYPRPYDLDSEAGLDNNGNDNIAPFVEIHPKFSLNYDVNRENDYAWLAENYLIGEEVEDPVTETIYPKSTIQYGAQTYERYHFSSNNSKLWINFYKNYKDTINGFYSILRNYYGYGPDTIISLCQSVLIDKLGVAQYNQDFQNKYLKSEYQNLAYGNRWYKFKKWLTKRFAFCDSYFGATDSATYDLTSRINYTIKVDAPQYIAQQYQGESNRITKFVLDDTTFSAGSGAATKITLLVNQPSVFETTLFKYVTLSGNGSRNYRNLLTLDVSGNRNPLFTNITSVTGDNLDNLKYLNISNSAVQNIDVPRNVKTLLANNDILTSFVIPNGCAVEEISLVGTTFLGNVDFSGLPNLKRLDLTNCTFNQNVTFSNLPVLENLIMDRAIFNGNVTISEGVNVTSFDFSHLSVKSISFSGSNLQIDTINFSYTQFTDNVLNLDAICKNIKNLYFDYCTGLEYLQIYDNKKFEHLVSFSIHHSSIKALGASNNAFDCVHFNNMSGVRSVYSFNDDGTITYWGFTFFDTLVEHIVNMDWTGSGENLFRACQYLLSITGTINITTTSMYYMFYKCYVLTTLPTINVSSNVTNAISTFAGANALSYNDVKNVIRQCVNVTDFNSVFRCKQFETGQVISLDELFGNNHVATNFDQAFSQYGVRWEFTEITNNVVITGTLPSTITSAWRVFYGFQTISVPYNLLSTASSLQNATGMFAFSTVTFTGNNLPIQVDDYGNKTLTNAVNRNFFSSSLTDISHMFYNTNVITNDGELFSNMPNLVSTNSTFGHGSLKAFSYTNNNNTTEIIKLNVANMWASNPLIEDISGCFDNIYSVYCTDLNFDQSITSSRTINISGLFGLYDDTYRDFAQISIDIDSIVPKIKTDSVYSVPDNNYHSGHGVFQNRSVILRTTGNDGTIFSKLNNISRYMFYKAVIYLDNSINTFNLTNITESCQGMFEACRLYKYSNEQNHVYDVNDRKFVNVIMPTRCADYISMFANSSVLNSLPTLNSTNAAYFQYMYTGCVINSPDLELPSNYFEICASSVTNTHAMFYGNKYITTLQYSASRGLFEGCVNLSDAAYMFYDANFLHKGIPVNFFGETDLPKLTNISYMFAYTSILYDIEDDSHKWINSSTIAPLINLENISGMFCRSKISAGSNNFQSTHGTLNQTVQDGLTEVAIIDPETFTTKTITNISKLFEYTPINPPVSMGLFRFVGFSIGNDAFFGCDLQNISDNFVETRYISSILSANRMFYQVPSYSNLAGQSINGLSTFVDKLIEYPNISKYNIAGNLIDPDIPVQYTTATTEGNAEMYTGIGLLTVNDPEASWTYYGRYLYA